MNFRKNQYGLYYAGGNERDSVVVSIVGMCITGYLMELWVTLFAGVGKLLFSFSMCCKQSYP